MTDFLWADLTGRQPSDLGTKVSFLLLPAPTRRGKRIYRGTHPSN